MFECVVCLEKVSLCVEQHRGYLASFIEAPLQPSRLLYNAEGLRGSKLLCEVEPLEVASRLLICIKANRSHHHELHVEHNNWREKETASLELEQSQHRSR